MVAVPFKAGMLFSNLILIGCLIVFFFPLAGCVSSLKNEGSKVDLPAKRMSVEEMWGIKILSIRQSAGGYMVDFRYRIVDPQKASALFAPGVTPYLVDQASGTKLSIPNMPKTGLLRAKGGPESGRDYFMIFGNSRQIVKKGSKVAVVAGDFKAENLTVE